MLILGELWSWVEDRNGWQELGTTWGQWWWPMVALGGSGGD